MFGVVVILRLAMELLTAEGTDEAARMLYEIYQTLLAFRVLCVAVVMLRFVSVYRPLGILIIVLQRMISDDILTFMLLFAVLAFGCSFSLTALQLAGHWDMSLDKEERSSFKTIFSMDHGGFWSPWW